MHTQKLFGPPIVEFEVQIPTGQNFELSTSFLRNNKRKKYPLFTVEEFDKKNFNQQNFGSATNMLIPEEKYKVSFLPFWGETILPKECLVFLNSIDSLLVGAEGMLTLLRIAKQKMPKAAYLNFFNKKEDMWKDSQSLRRFPNLYIHLDNEVKVSLGYYDAALTKTNLLVSIIHIAKPEKIFSKWKLHHIDPPSGF